MKLFNKKIGFLISVMVLGTALVGCSGGGKCDTNINPNPTITPSPTATPDELSLSLSAPDQYPAGMPTPITAYLTMTNTSTVDANNLVYAIPNSDNHTGVAISVENGASQPCLNIPAGKSCTFPAIIGAYANPGSFKVTATPNGTSSISTKALFASNTLSLTANIGLTDVPTNVNSGANGISFLYAQTVAASTIATQVSIVAVVSSAEAGDFNTINLTDASGALLNFQVLSGNSGNGLTNLVQGSIVTFLLTIPAGTSSYKFYAQTMNNGIAVNQGSIANPINLVDSNQGILVVQPTSFNLSAAANYTSQVITYTNIGNANVTDLTIGQAFAPLKLSNNTCSSSLTPGQSCTVTLTSEALAGTSGTGSFTSHYTTVNGVVNVVSQYNYAGANPVSGINITAVNNFVFSTDTDTGYESTQVTLENSGNVDERNFSFGFEPNRYFTLSSGTSGTPCIVNNNVVADVLKAKTSCTLMLTYTNSEVTVGSPTAIMTIDYYYNGIEAPSSSKTLSYSTQQVVIPPQVNMISPSNGESGVSTTLQIKAQFSEAVLNVTESTVFLRKDSDSGALIPISISSESNNIYVITPLIILNNDTKYYITFSNMIKNISDTNLVATTYNFTTTDFSYANMQGLLATATSYSCAIQPLNGKAYCWGSNTGGELGNGTFDHTGTPVEVVMGGSSAIPSGSILNSISVGTSKGTGGGGGSCAITSLGKLYCWGDNRFGALGVGIESTVLESSPYAMAVLTGSPSAIPSSAFIMQTSSNNINSCAIDRIGNVYCWGYEEKGQFGIGTVGESTHLYPIQVVKGGNSAIPESAVIIQVATGGTHTCVLDNVGEMYCIGDNYRGELGDGTKVSSNYAVKVLKGGNSAIPLNAKITQISVNPDNSTSRATTCAIADNQAYCWGRAKVSIGDGQLESIYPTAVLKGGLSAIPESGVFQAVSAAGYQMCALVDNKAYCWGDNTRGQLGDNSETQSSYPVAVTTGAPGEMPANSLLINIGTSYDNGIENGMSSCSMSLNYDLYCWGDNLYGELGIGSIGIPESSSVPLKVLLPR